MTGAEFKAWRTRLGLTQEQLAQQLEVTARGVSKWENDDVPISRTVRLACAAIEAGLKQIID